MTDLINWSQHDLDGLKQLYWDEVAPALRRDSRDPHTRPSYQTVADLGYGGITYTLRERHELTLKEFFLDVVGLEDPSASAESDGYRWGISHEPTKDAFESFLKSLSRRRELVQNTLDTKRTHLATYARIYEDLHGASDLLSPVQDTSKQAREVGRADAVLDCFDTELGSGGSKLNYAQTVSSWYERLERRGRVAFNPLTDFRAEFQKWKPEDPDNEPLEPHHVRALYRAADGFEQQLLVVALAGWGLRVGEVARLHQRQFVGLNSDDPHIEFEERKNGPSTVAVLYGVDVLADRLDELTNRTSWNGYLFPSRQSDSGHRHPDTIRRRFEQLAQDAGVRVDGRKPKPHMARRFWYTAYQRASAELVKRLEDIAEDQGSSSGRVVADSYLSKEEKRHARRDAMQSRLADAFENLDS